MSSQSLQIIFCYFVVSPHHLNFIIYVFTYLSVANCDVHVSVSDFFSFGLFVDFSVFVVQDCQHWSNRELRNRFWQKGSISSQVFKNIKTGLLSVLVTCIQIRQISWMWNSQLGHWFSIKGHVVRGHPRVFRGSLRSWLFQCAQCSCHIHKTQVWGNRSMTFKCSGIEMAARHALWLTPMPSAGKPIHSFS